MKRIGPFLLYVLFSYIGIAETTLVYTHSGQDGLILSSAERWYFEEFDALERPVSGTLWVKGEIVERRSWLYTGDTAQAEKKIITRNTSDGAVSTIEMDYDEKGNISGEIRKNEKNEIISTLGNSYNEKNQLSESSLTEGSKNRKTEFVYDDNEMLVEKRVYIDGELAIVYAYTSEDNWTETIYTEGTAILVVVYENGARKKDTRESK